MPRIPEIGFSTQPVGPQSTPQLSAGALAAPGAGLKQVGGTLQQAGNTLQDIRDKQSLFEAELQYMENEKQVLDQFEQAKQEAPEGADGFTEQVTQRYDDWLPEALNQAPATTVAQQSLQLKYQRLRGQLTQNAMQFEARSRANRDSRRMAVIQDGLSNEARTNFNDLDSILAKGQELVNNVPFWDEQQRGKISTELRQRVYNSSLDGWVTEYEINPVPEEDLDKAISALKNNFRGYKKEVDSGVYDQALTRLENRKRAVAEESKTLLGKDLQDTLAAIQINGPSADPGYINAERLSKVYPDDPELRNRIMRQVSSAKNIYNIGQQAALTTPEEDMAVLAKLKSQVAGRGAQFEAQNFKDHYQAIQRKWQEYSADPVKYILRTDPSLAQDMRQAETANDPEEFSLVLNRLDKRQERMGTPSWRREYLGKGAAIQVADQLTGMGAEDAANVMEQLQNKYQEKWPQVMRELESQRIDPRFMVLGIYDRPEDVSLRKELAAAYQAGSDKLRTNIGNTNASDIDSAVAKLMPEFNATMVNAGRTGQENISRMTDATKTLAYSIFQKGGKTSTEAAETAFKLLLGTRYDFGPSYRAPKGEIGAVEQAAGIVLNKLRPEQFAPAAPGFGVDPTVAGSEAGLNYRRQAAYVAAVKMGKWLNTPNGDGIMLFKQDDSTGQGYSPVVLEDGSNVVLRFNDIRNNPPPSLEEVSDEYGIGIIN